MMNDKELLNEVLINPKTLWKILTSEHKILGPWTDHCGSSWSYGKNSFARFHYTNFRMRSGSSIPDHKVYIRKSSKLNEPQEYEFHEWGGIDWEGLEKARKEWEKEKLQWKEWEYVYVCGRDREQHYTYSKEEAIKLADELVKNKGYLLYDGD